MARSEKDELEDLFSKLLNEADKMDDPVYRKKLLDEANEIFKTFEEEEDDKDFDA